MKTKEELITQKIAEFKKIIYGDDPGLECFGEHEKIQKFVEDFYEDIKKFLENE